MPDLLLELFSEEIPARMQRQAADDLRRLVTDGMVAAGLTYEGARAFVTPRRLALTVQGVSARSAEVREEKRGPRVGAPDAAIQGFLKSAGLASLDQASVQSDPKKGDFYVATLSRPGRAAEAILADILPEAIRAFPWPKSMRWGARSAPLGSRHSPPEAAGATSLRWVRPLRAIVATFGPETESPTVVPFEIGGVAAGDVTFGHRFLAAAEPIRVRRFDDYVAALEAARVVLDLDRRKAMIEAEAANLAFAQGYEPVADAGLLEEVAGLVEWPVVLMGRFDEEFLAIPPEVVRLTIRHNQKCFVLRAAGAGEAAPLAARFLLVANIEATDGGAAIVAGNERVIAARLADARFFWEQDRKMSLAAHREKLAGIVFHEKLGSQADRVERIARLARALARACGADPDEAEEAARLAKADLVTGMVGEFPELQGVMGRYYHLAKHRLSPLPQADEGAGDEAAAGEAARHRRIADAIRDHYRPQGPADAVPAAPVTVAAALADRLDTLVGFWAVDEKPTGSKDPYALRRAALGVIRLLLDNQIRIPIGHFVKAHLRNIFTYVQLAEPFGLLQQASEWHVEDIWKELPRYPRALRLLDFDGLYSSWGEAYLDFMSKVKEHSPKLGTMRNPKFDLHGVWTFYGDRPVFTKYFSQSELKVGSYSLSKLHNRILEMYGLATETDNIHELPSLLDYNPLTFSGRFPQISGIFSEIAADLLAFFADRLKVHLREQGARHDLIDAVFALPGQDDLVAIVRRVDALGRFLDSDDGANLLVGWRRAANILRAEERKDGAGAFDAAPDAALAAEKGLPEERTLFEVMEAAERQARACVAAEDFAGAMAALAALRPAVDAFFDKVTVNAEDAALRANRLKLLNRLRRATDAVADFSRIAG